MNPYEQASLAALLLATAALFLIANRAAYKGYFQDDELNSIAWTSNLVGELGAPVEESPARRL
jgi:hypothetical protein